MRGSKKLHIKLFLGAIVATFVAVLSLAAVRADEQARLDRLQRGIAKQIIRFHIRANSDSDEDQRLKLLVKEKVVEYVGPLLSDSSGIDESRNILSQESENIRQLALDIIRQQGYDYDVTVYFEKSFFPMKTYGDLSFPPGEYEAFRIDIGSSEGKNWWCVLYPPLCFVDSVYADVPDKSRKQLKDCLTDEEYNVVSGKDKVRYRFKYLTFFNKYLE